MEQESNKKIMEQLIDIYSNTSPEKYRSLVAKHFKASEWAKLIMEVLLHPNV